MPGHDPATAVPDYSDSLPGQEDDDRRTSIQVARRGVVKLLWAMAPPAPAPNTDPLPSGSTDLVEKFTLRELDDNVAWMRELFKQYLSWYTFFITANLGVLSWIFTKDISKGTAPLAILFVLLNVCGMITASLLGRYISRAEDRNRALILKLNLLAQLEGEAAMRPTFPTDLAKNGFFFISLGLAVIAALWVIAAVYF